MTLVPRSLLPHSGSIVVLNGTSSSGKTSLAKALQAVAPEQYLHVQLNAYRDMEPVGYFSRERSEAWPMRVAALCRAMHSTVIEFSGHGQNVIFDHVMSSDAWHYLLEDFQDQRLFLIRVHCDVEELLRREQARGDREHGLRSRRRSAFTKTESTISQSILRIRALRSAPPLYFNGCSRTHDPLHSPRCAPGMLRSNPSFKRTRLRRSA